ncbi:MAG: hypothetical protein QOJ03_281, partial [Frankiaceae bacterium]|nr:hypothetical protein [Frankiaceae bacterium]
MSREEPRISAGHDKAAAAERIRVLAHVLIYRLGGPVVRLLPGRLLLPVFLGLGRLAHRLNSPRARLLRETFGDVRSELEARDLDELVRAAALSRSRYWYEFLAFRSMTI